MHVENLTGLLHIRPAKVGLTIGWMQCTICVCFDKRLVAAESQMLVKICFFHVLLSPPSKVSREVANLTWRKNTHTPVYGVKEFVCLCIVNPWPPFWCKPKTLFLPPSSYFCSFLTFFMKKMWKRIFLTSVWSAEYPNAGIIIQHTIVRKRINRAPCRGAL